MFVDLNRSHTSININMNFSEYKIGYTLFATDFSPDLAASVNHINVNKSGHIAIDFKFDVDLFERVNLIVYAEILFK